MHANEQAYFEVFVFIRAVRSVKTEEIGKTAACIRFDTFILAEQQARIDELVLDLVERLCVYRILIELAELYVQVLGVDKVSM